MKKITKIFTIAMFCAAAIVCASCGGNKKSNKTGEPKVKSEAEMQTETLIKIHLDSLGRDLVTIGTTLDKNGQEVLNTGSVGVVDGIKAGKVQLTEKELQLKPEYLADPSYVNNLQTLSQKYRAIAILAVDKEVAKLYEMPTEDYDKSLVKLYAEINDSALKTFITSDDYVESIDKFYTSSIENERQNLFWDAVCAGIIEELYIATQNADKFLAGFTDESASNFAYHITLLSIAIEDLATINPEYTELYNSLKPLEKITSIDLATFKKDILSAKADTEASRANLMK